MSTDAIDSILADFRTWLEALPDAAAPRPTAPPAVDLGTLAAQFTALRHDVNLQTKATRAVLDQSGEAIKHLARPATAHPESHLKPTRKLLVDLADALSLSLHQVTRAGETLTNLGVEDAEAWPAMPSAPTAATFWRRLSGRASPSAEWLAWADAMRSKADVFIDDYQAARDQLAPVLAGLADGYTLSLRRVERAFPQFDLEPIECEGEAFDPELMEVVEVIGDSDAPSGTVVTVVRAGYRVNGQVFRFAQVAVAR